MDLIPVTQIFFQQMCLANTLDIVNGPGPSSQCAIRVNGSENMICENHQCPRNGSLRGFWGIGSGRAKVWWEDQEGSYLAKRRGKSGGVIDIVVMTAEFALDEEQAAPWKFFIFGLWYVIKCESELLCSTRIEVWRLNESSELYAPEPHREYPQCSLPYGALFPRFLVEHRSLKVFSHQQASQC